jgi:hypothetical protein
MIPIDQEIVVDNFGKFISGHLFRIVAGKNLNLDAPPHTFAFGVIMAASGGRVHALFDFKVGYHFAKLIAGILATTV